MGTVESTMACVLSVSLAIMKTRQQSLLVSIVKFACKYSTFRFKNKVFFDFSSKKFVYMRKFNYLCTRFWAFPPKSAPWYTASPGFVIGQYQRERHGGAWLESSFGCFVLTMTSEGKSESNTF
jgi:hypothetical protein